MKEQGGAGSLEEENGMLRGDCSLEEENAWRGRLGCWKDAGRDLQVGGGVWDEGRSLELEGGLRMQGGAAWRQQLGEDVGKKVVQGG